ncbi:hypothetical protein POTOM_028113 [Populus tomentosa]|uniref:Uncharacterized protein n=1 Tax=Populus tomentosa TaxID=118781 RepID=A0A8X7ZDW2_POPTO|nr:hypothetical protein POTOM_028113 [Populus tomentosa]
MIRKTGLPLNFLLSTSKIVGYVSSMLFLVSAESGIATSDIFPIESIVAASSMVCTTVAYDPGIATSWVVCTTVVAESRVATDGIFPVEPGVAASTIESEVTASGIFPVESSVVASSMVCTTIAIYPSIVVSWVVYTIVVAESGIAATSIFANDSCVTVGNMVYTSLPLLRLITLVFSLGLIST